MAARSVITLGGGCFWCIEASFNMLKGCSSAVSGYMGGHVPSPSYKAVCEGDTGHAEVVQVTFDEATLPLEKVLKVFFTVHDPTQLNRQGNDVGTQYRSVIFWHTPEQKAAVEAFIEANVKPAWAPKRVVTEIVPAAAHTFYKAEEYHQRYFELNPGQGYCRAVVRPKVEKVAEKFSELLK